MFDRKKHWEGVYNEKEFTEVSWYQQTPHTSLSFLKEFDTPKSSKIIDIGGGDSFFVDHLLMLGYTDITVLDLSETAINKAKSRLGEQASKVKWIVADSTTFVPEEKYDFWHDRATFHFITDKSEINNYIKTIKNNLIPNGVVIIGTFSNSGPTKCSGIEIKQYGENDLISALNAYFEKIKCINVDHETPFNTKQNFTFCSFKKLQAA